MTATPARHEAPTRRARRAAVRRGAVLVTQPTAAPSAKLKAVGVTGLATAAVLWAAHAAGLELPEPVAEGIVLAAGWAAGYLKRDKTVAGVIARAQATLAPLLGTPAGAALEAVLEADLERAAAPTTLAGVEAPAAPEARRGPQAS